MRRICFCLLCLVTVLSGSGCATSWDTVTSRKFRHKPFGTLFPSDDPLTTLRNSTEGDERAAAMQRLKEPNRHGKTSEDQDDAIRLLSTAAVADPSPVVRIAAVDCLGRFQDERAIAILNSAYYAADGIPSGVDKPKRIARPVGSDEPMILAERFGLRGPVGFADEVASAIRSRAVDALANTGKAEALPVLAQAAQGGPLDAPIDRDTQLAAIRGLERVRVKEAPAVLVAVLKAEKGKDPALMNRAAESLISLTGKKLPAEASVWEAALKSGEAAVVPQSTGLIQVGAWITK